MTKIDISNVILMSGIITTKTHKASITLALSYCEGRLQRFGDGVDTLFRITKQHLSVLLKEQWVLNASVTGVHRAFEDNHVLRIPHF